MLPLMLYDPIRGTPKPYPSEANQFRWYSKNEAWYFDPYTGYNREPSEVMNDPLGLQIQPPTNTSNETQASDSSVEVGVSLADKQLEAGVKLTSEFGDSGVLVANASVDQDGEAKVTANFKLKF